MLSYHQETHTLLSCLFFKTFPITSSAIKRHMPPEKYRQQVAIDRYIIHLNYKQIMSDTRSTRYEEHVPPPDLKRPPFEDPSECHKPRD